MRIYLLIAAFFKVSLAVSTLRDQNLQDESTTLPTELFKPLVPVTEAGTATHQVPKIVPHLSNRGHLGEEYGSEVHSNFGNQYNSDGNTGIRRVSHPLFPVRSEKYEQSSSQIQPLDIPSLSFFDKFGNVHNYQQSPIQVGSHYQFSSHFPTANMYDTSFNEGPDMNSGNGHYRYSSSSTYYNSNTMDAPQTHGFEYDSRRGGFEYK